MPRTRARPGIRPWFTSRRLPAVVKVYYFARISRRAIMITTSARRVSLSPCVPRGSRRLADLAVSHDRPSFEAFVRVPMGGRPIVQLSLSLSFDNLFLSLSLFLPSLETVAT